MSMIESPNAKGDPEPGRATAEAERARAPTGTPAARVWLRRRAWWIVALALVLCGAVLVEWAGTRPSYDAYGWLVWGYQTLHLHLDLGGSPSWKPLPFLLTVPYALAGHDELHLWMVTAVAAALAGGVFGGRIAYRVVLADAPDRRRAAWAAAAFAGVTVLGLEDYAHDVLSVQSDPIIVTLTLAAIDLHLCGRRRWALALGVLAGLGRPEAWCLLAPYSLYLWLRAPSLRWMVAAGWGVIVFMWFGVPTITNGRPFVSAQLAFNSPRALRHNEILGTIGRFAELYYLPIWLAAGGTVVWAILRRRWLVVTLAAAVPVWVLTEIVFALHGWPGLPRYMFEPAAICGVIAGIGFGWLLLTPVTARRGALRFAGPVLALVLVAVLIPDARGRYDTERHDLQHERQRTHQANTLASVVAALGGAQIRSCGDPTVGSVKWLTTMAYTIQMDVGKVGYKPHRHRRAAVVFTPLSKGGWVVRPIYIPPASRARCARLHAEWIATRAHPGGVLVHLG